MAEESQRDRLVRLLVEELIAPTLPQVQKALLATMGASAKLRDMKAAYVILDVARDIITKGGPTIPTMQELNKMLVLAKRGADGDIDGQEARDQEPDFFQEVSKDAERRRATPDGDRSQAS